MKPISFAILTDTPQRLRNFLIDRGVMKLVDNPDPDVGGQVLVGTRPGMEWVQLDNPIKNNLGEQDPRKLFLVKFAADSLENEIDGDTAGDQYDWSKFGKWVKNNSGVVTAPAGWTMRGEPVGDAHKINGEQVWLINDRPERFGTWQ